MIIVRNIFRLKFGQAKQATQLWKQAAAELQNSGYGGKGFRLLTDLAGLEYYTIVFESSFDSLAAMEKAHLAARDNEKWRKLYDQIVQLTESGRREILSVIE